MWPYDYFNQYSGLINEFEVEGDVDLEKSHKELGGKIRKIFVAMWFGGEKEERKENVYKDFIKKVAESINDPKIEINARDEGRIEDSLCYRLQTTIGGDKKGDIKFDILGKIIEATLVICDVTPMNKEKLEKKEDKDAIFNANVVAELGIALAWKTPEQVIIISDKIKDFSLANLLPFNLKGYFVEEIDFANISSREQILKTIIEDRFKEIKSEKQLIIKNIQSRLDRKSLDILSTNRGLPFSLKESILIVLNKDIIEPALSAQIAVRNLLELGLIRSIIFPQKENKPSNDSVYYFTELGRFFLKKGLRIENLFPSVIADLLLIGFWESYEDFSKKKKDFEELYKITWVEARDLLGELLKVALEEQRTKIIKYNDREEIDIIATFNFYTKEKEFELIMDKIVMPWLKKIKFSRIK